jgi:heme A synthase
MLVFQIFLGALTVLTMKNEYVATLHMLLGAFLLAATWVLTFACHRLPLEAKQQIVPLAGATEARPAFKKARA